MKYKAKVLLIGEITNSLREKLIKNNYFISAEQNRCDYDCIVFRGNVQIPDELVSNQRQLKTIISAGIGTDNINREITVERNITVINCPYASSISVAEHTLGLLLSGAKKITKSYSELKSGKWNRTHNIPIELNGKKITVIGMGSIGAHVAQLFKSLGMDVIGYDPYLHKYNFATRNIYFEENLERAIEGTNFISIHVPKTSKTTGLITKEHIRSMDSPNGIINTARGGIVSEDVIERALSGNYLDFYMADVFETEPKPRESLLEMENVVFTPHIAANSIEAQEQIARDVIGSLNEICDK